MSARLSTLFAFVLVLALPLLVRALNPTTGTGGRAADIARHPSERDAPRLVIVTPHVEQIRVEFERAFKDWHARTHASPVRIDWRVPGGTSEIIKQLEAQFDAAAAKGLINEEGVLEAGAAGFDLFFGGGSYEHGKMKQARKAPVVIGGERKEVTYRMGRPAGFTEAQFDEWFGVNKIGVQTLYDPEQYWIGTALSGFGIVYNRLVLKDLGLPEPRSFGDLCSSKYFNMLALADPRLSGSVTTTYESILNKEGWDRGWRTLREMSGNARYFASASTKPPVDVSQGEAAAGLSIDFYGRGQSQFTLKPGQAPSESRVGYVDPQGAVYIDADPASILNGAANPEIANHFVEFCLSEEGQALWQFRVQRGEPAGTGSVTSDTTSNTTLGPRQYELRRMPIRRIMYEKYADQMIDKENPFDLASDVPSRGWRDAIGPMMAAFGIDTADECRAAWKALCSARAAAQRGHFPTEALAEMECLFYSFPMHAMADGRSLSFNAESFKTIRDDTKKWKDPLHGKRSLIAYTEFFRGAYGRVIEMYREHKEEMVKR